MFQGKNLQFDQWRIAHLAEFGINSLDNAPSTPAPTRPAPTTSKTRAPRTPKTKRKDAEREGSERRAKTRRDSEPTPEPDIAANKNDDSKDDKENTKPNKFGSLFDSLCCGHCGSGFNNLMEYISHKKVCIPDEDFGFAEKKSSKATADKTSTESNSSTSTTSTSKSTSSSSDTTDSRLKSSNTIHSKTTNTEKTDVDKKDQPENEAKINPEIGTKDENVKASDSSFHKIGKDNRRKNSSSIHCDNCDQKFVNMVKYEKHRAFCTHSR